jgi:predicted AAA+ superfamily ATPase
MISRQVANERVRSALTRAPVVVLTGPRQAGKSTLAQSIVHPSKSHIFDLEDPRDLSRLGEPTLSLPLLDGTVVIDEAQRSPALFPVLRVLVDEDRRPGRFLVLGSASPDLIGLSAESLAGRVTFVELPGLMITDVGTQKLSQLWLRGGLPLSFLAADEPSARWRDDYIATFLERDLAGLGFRLAPTAMRRFWTMVAHYHGQTWNGAELSRALGVSQPTVRGYLDALTDSLMIRQLQPWFANISKRQVKAPKVYVRDSGLLHRLLGLTTMDELLSHPKVGASWEGFVIEQLLTLLEPREASFWATHQGAEIDLVTTIDSRRLAFEVKRTDQPRMTPSIRSALRDLELDNIYVVHAGNDRFEIAERVTAVPATELLIAGLQSL